MFMADYRKGDWNNFRVVPYGHDLRSPKFSPFSRSMMQGRTSRSYPGSTAYRKPPFTIGSPGVQVWGHANECLKRVKELEEENRKLKHMYADLALDNKMPKDVLGKKC